MSSEFNALLQLHTAAHDAFDSTFAHHTAARELADEEIANARMFVERRAWIPAKVRATHREWLDTYGVKLAAAIETTR